MKPSIRLDSDLLRTFLAVAAYGNVTRAATALNRTQSAVSLQIKRLEERLAVALFRREPRGVVLTEAGERLRLAAERIVGHLDHTLRTFRADPVGGLVRVGIPDEYGSDVLPAILASFSARYPSVEVVVRCGLSERFPEIVDRGDLDLAVFADSGGPGGPGGPGGLDRPGALVHDPMTWVSSRPYRCRRDVPVPLALFDHACSWRDMTVAALERAGQPYRVVFTSESVSGIKAAVASGLAVGVLARSTVDGAMRVLTRRHGLPALPESVLRLVRGRSRSPAVEAMAAAIEEGFTRVARPAPGARRAPSGQ